ncbi:MAG TPA: hypothetical protein GX717_00755 [Clostridiaceae bacterium]|nr:hypothetical protein [Clostridiaceae bacterium]
MKKVKTNKTPSRSDHATDKSPVKQTKKSKRPSFLILIVALILIYGIYGTIGPYIGNRTLNPLWQNRFSTTGFYNNTDLYGPDRIRMLSTFEDSNVACLNAIDSAVENLVICLDEFAETDVNALFTGALLNAASRGVNVEILLDGTIKPKQQPYVKALATDQLITISEYRPIQPLLPWTYHSRMGDCFLVADDRLAWYSEGDHFSNNPQDQWDLLIYNSLANSRQSALSITSELKNYHISLWNSRQTERLTNASLADSDAAKTADELKKNWLDKQKDRLELQSAHNNYIAETQATKNITLIKNPVNDANKEPYVWFQFSRLMEEAKHEVTILTPTIAFSPAMLDDMEKITGSVEKVRLITQTPEAKGAYCKRSDYRYNRSSIINTGLQIFETQHPQSNNIKALLIDHNLTALGSYGWDLASTYTQTASALVIQSEELNRQIQSDSQSLIEESLMVRPDGQYNPSDNLTPLESTTWHKVTQFIVGFFLQFFRTLV